jgi:hypothetical protein
MEQDAAKGNRKFGHLYLIVNWLLADAAEIILVGACHFILEVIKRQ